MADYFVIKIIVTMQSKIILLSKLIESIESILNSVGA